VPEKHCKTDDQDALRYTTGHAPHPTSSTIEQEPGKPGAVTELPGSEPLLPSFSFLQETVPWYLGGRNDNKDLLDTPKDIGTASSNCLIDCLGKDSDEDVNVAADEFDTHVVSTIVSPQAVAPSYPTDSNNVDKLLSGAMSSTLVHNAHDAESQAAMSESKTLSSMSSIYGSKSLYQVRKRVSSQSTKSSLPEMRTFDTTIDATLCGMAAQKPLRFSHEEAPELIPSPHNLDNRTGKASLEVVMNGNILQIVDLLSDFRNGIDVNHRSSASNGQTPLMVIIRQSGFVFRELMILCLVTHQWPHLSSLDNDGKSIIDLAAADGAELIVTRFIERIVAALCCECSDQARRASLCEWIAHTAPSERCGLVLEGGPVRYPFRTECQWGERLLRHNWLKKETLMEIDHWMRRCISRINSSHRARMVNELRDMYCKPDQWTHSIPME
jgi:hypothetical protein